MNCAEIAVQIERYEPLPGVGVAPSLGKVTLRAEAEQIKIPVADDV